MAEILRFARTYALEDIEIQRSGDGRTVTAYAAMFDTPYEVKDQYGHYDEVVERSAFNKTLADHGVSRTMALFNHGMTVQGTPSDAYSVPIGTPLEIRPDTRGLLTVTRYNEGPDVDRILEAIRNGAIRSQSFRGRIFRSSPNLPKFSRRYEAGPDGKRTTVIRHELGLSDYGPTPIPMNAGAEIVAVRSMLDITNELAGLDEDRLAELIRALSPTTSPGQAKPEATTTTATTAAGTEEPRDAHSGRIDIRRNKLRAEMDEAGVFDAATP